MSKYSSTHRFLSRFLVLGLGHAASMAHANEAEDGGMQWSFTPYLWMSDTSMKASVHDLSITESELKFRDIVDKVELAFQGHLEGYGDHFGFFLDATYISVSDDSRHEEISVDTEIDTGIYELAAMYNLPGKGVDGLSLFAGVRYLTMDQEIKLSGGNDSDFNHKVSEDGNWTDFMIGARYGFTLSENWLMGLRADYSEGDSEGSFNFQALLGYRIPFGFGGTAMVGYRYLDMEFEEGPLKSETTMSGPMIGVRYAF